MSLQHRSGRRPRLMQQGTVKSILDNHGFLTLSDPYEIPGGEEALFHRRGVGDPWGFEDFKIGDRVVCTTVEVKVKGQTKVRAYDVRIMDPRRRPRDGKGAE